MKETFMLKVSEIEHSKMIEGLKDRYGWRKIDVTLAPVGQLPRRFGFIRYASFHNEGMKSSVLLYEDKPRLEVVFYERPIPLYANLKNGDGGNKF